MLTCCHRYPPIAQVEPQFYAFRWITLLLTQEFPFPDAVRIWDALLADPAGRMDCLLRVCVALLCNVRDTLLQGACVRTVQCGCPMET
jgi:TBC1 domain family member 13